MLSIKWISIVRVIPSLIEWDTTGNTTSTFMQIGCISRVLLLDYSKAFDLVDHNILVKMLYSYDVPDFLVHWIGSFLSGRRQL